MTKDEGQLNAAKQAYRTAEEVGNREEEARWANVIGHILKNRGEYVKALKWLRIDYEISVKYLPEKQLLATCQSIGEVYLRLLDFQNALTYQKKHLELAKDANDIIEQQRATTQLGRTYHEIFLKSEDDHSSVRNAKKYFKSAMELAQILKENPPTNKSSFLKEYIDAHNNIGMLEMDLDNFREAKKILTKGLEICDEEEVNENDDARSRLHHNLGTVYLEMRVWDEASKHIKKDIAICKKIGHCQGEAKGFINLGELHYRNQNYDKAISCYQRALSLAKSMEDEDALAKQIHQNIATVKQAVMVMEELKKEEQNFKKLTRNVENAIGKPHERKGLVHQLESLDRLIEKSSMIFAWDQHCKYAKCKKRIAKNLCDKEKLGDSFLVLGESYLKLRNFDKALKWVKKGLETYQAIGNLEGQALAKNNIGDVLDSDGKWMEALNAFKESYRIAVENNLPSIQLSALENMHYSYMMRFDNVEEARRLQRELSNLKRSVRRELETVNLARDYCSETDTDGDGHLSDDRPNESFLPEISKSSSTNSKHANGLEELNDDEPLISFLRSRKQSSQKQTTYTENCNTNIKFTEASPKCSSKTTSHQTIVGRKRVRVILSDDEDETNDENCFEGLTCRCSVPQRNDASDVFKKKNDVAGSSYKFEDFSRIESKCVSSSCNPVNIEESCSSHKSPKVMVPTEKISRSLSADEAATSGSKHDIDISLRTKIKYTGAHLKLYDFSSNQTRCIGFRIDDVQIDIEGDTYFPVDETSMESMKVELACLYFLYLPAEKRAKGLLPIIQHIKYDGKVLEPLEAFDIVVNNIGNILLEVSISGWVQKRLMKLYIDFCEELSEISNMKLLKRLYISEVEDELVASECDLQDISITPLLNALHTHKTAALLDLSHNLLGNGTMEKLQKFFISGQTYGDLTLDLHCNRFGPTALFQICECPVLFARLEVLNISGNRLTDACGSYLSTILEKCRALYSLNLAQCSITSRTIQKIADAVTSGSVLAQLSIGYNNPISGNAIIHLLTKLASLESFTELNFNGINIKINKLVIDSLCQLAERSCLSRLMLGSTGIGNDGAVQLTESLFSQSKESVKLDLSYCGLTATYIQKLNNDDNLVSGILELNLEGNPIRQEGTSAITTLLTNSQCCLKVLVLNKCQLELAGVVRVIKALSENEHLEELHLAYNINKDNKHSSTDYNSTAKTSADISTCKSSSKEADMRQQVSCAVNTDQLEVADSEDNLTMEDAGPEYDDCCTSSYDRNSSLEGQSIQEGLSIAISQAKQLQLLDLSNNDFSNLVGEVLYAAWSSRLGSGSPRKHIKEQVMHFSMDLNPCCRVKPCCRKD